MSIRTQYSCPKCRNIISSYSKKGFESLHTNIGLPYLRCVNCLTLIKTNHSPYNKMQNSVKVFEWVKIILNVSIYSLLFGFLIGFVLGWLINEFLLNSREQFNFWVIALTTATIFIILLRRYLKWIDETNNYNLSNEIPVNSDAYSHPDW